MLIIDLDKNKILYDDNYDKETFKMPDRIINELKADIYNLLRIAKLRKESQKNIELCWIFLRFFIKTIGNYKDFIIPLERNVFGERESIFLVSKCKLVNVNQTVNF